VVAEFAERAISAIEGGRQALAELDGLAHGSLLIGASTTPGLYVLPRIVAAFRTKYPGVNVKLQIANSQAIEGRVRERELDLGIVGGHALRPGEECLTAGMRDELVLIVGAEHDGAWAEGYMATREEDIIRRYFGAFNKHDLEGVIACFHPEPVVVDNEGWRHEGVDAVRRLYRFQFSLAADGRCDLRTLVGYDGRG